LNGLVQRGQDKNFNFGAVSCLPTGFTSDQKSVKITQNIIELPYSPPMINMLKLTSRHLLAGIFLPLDQITPQMAKVTNQNLKV
jgi:hypothetical protein